jgi:hypothetical protein
MASKIVSAPFFAAAKAGLARDLKLLRSNTVSYYIITKISFLRRGDWWNFVHCGNCLGTKQQPGALWGLGSYCSVSEVGDPERCQGRHQREQACRRRAANQQN